MALLSVASARLSQACLLLFVMSLIGFIGVHSIGNPVFNIVNIETATPEDIRRATIALGLDQPVLSQISGRVVEPATAGHSYAASAANC